MTNLWIPHQVGALVFLGSLLLVALSNMRTLQSFGQHPAPTDWPRVSIVVPARDEEDNIGPCVRSLLAQQYPDFEVLALNDHSSDRTGEILAGAMAQDRRLRVLAGKPLPDGWLGKNWACQQLAEAARGELLLFTDADTYHDPRTLTDAVAALVAEKADLLSAFPHQEIVSWPEKLVVPILLWSSFAFLPLGLAYRVRAPALSVTIGQYMLFRREAYDRIGGYAAVRQDVVDDMVLGRLIKSHGLSWRLMDGGARISCRMYHNLREVYQGFSKNLFPMFQYNIASFVATWLWVAVVFLEPLVVLALRLSGALIMDPAVRLAGASVVCTLAVCSILRWRFRLPSYLVLLYPLTIAMTIAIAFSSMIQTLAGRASWKGRRLSRPKIRLW